MQARKNREIALLQRKIDEIPSRTELSQYQRRFIELYNQSESHVSLETMCMHGNSPHSLGDSPLLHSYSHNVDTSTGIHTCFN